MDFKVLDKKKRYIQLGTVMTDQDYRGKGLSRFLMERILQEWNGKSDLIYLYANNSVLNMYPKFGFTRIKEYLFFKSVKIKSKDNKIEKLDMGTQECRNILYSYVQHSADFGKLSMKNNADLVMFYCTSFLKDNIYFLKHLDVIAVATFDNNQLHLLDVFGKSELELDKVIDSLVNHNVNEVVLGFTPKNYNSYKVKELVGDDNLFIQTGKTKLFDDHKLMFPSLSHA